MWIHLWERLGSHGGVQRACLHFRYLTRGHDQERSTVYIPVSLQLVFLLLTSYISQRAFSTSSKERAGCCHLWVTCVGGRKSFSSWIVRIECFLVTCPVFYWRCIEFWSIFCSCGCKNQPLFLFCNGFFFSLSLWEFWTALRGGSSKEKLSFSDGGRSSNREDKCYIFGQLPVRGMVLEQFGTIMPRLSKNIRATLLINIKNRN